MNDRDEFDRTMAEIEKDPDHRVPGTGFIITNPAQFRAQHAPLFDGQKIITMEAKGIISALRKELMKKSPNLEMVIADLDNLLPGLERLQSEALSTSRRPIVSGVVMALQGAQRLLIALKAPIQNTLRLVRGDMSEAQRHVSSALALPLAADPNKPDEVKPASAPDWW